MKRNTKFIYGITIALITAASLHFTVGHRFHGRGFGHYGPNGYSSYLQESGGFNHGGCGLNERDNHINGSGDRRYWNGPEHRTEKLPLQSAPAEAPKDSF